MKSQLNTLPDCWLQQISHEFSKGYIDQLASFLQSREQSGATIYPKTDHFFKALKLTAFNEVKVVIVGQDPYHGPGQADGLSFSVAEGVALPPSLRNIFKELQEDLKIEAPKSGNLAGWASQGVLLLNSVLSVEKASAGAHRNKGWEKLTNSIIKRLEEQRKNLVFILWGRYAWQKGAFIDRNRHLVIETAHPSPLSAYRGFFGSQPFSKTNDYLSLHNKSLINWSNTSNKSG